MKIDQETLKKLAHLSRLEYDEENSEKLLESLNEILTWVEMLNEVDTSEVEMLKSMSQEVNAFRNDEAKNNLTREEGLSNGPEKNDEYFIVPKVIE